MTEKQLRRKWPRPGLVHLSTFHGQNQTREARTVREVRRVAECIAGAEALRTLPGPGEPAGRVKDPVLALLEPDAWKQARPVLRGQRGREAPALPDDKK